MKETLIKGSIGTTIPILAAITVPQVEAWLRITSLTVGIVVGVITAAGLIKRWNKR